MPQFWQHVGRNVLLMKGGGGEVKESNMSKGRSERKECAEEGVKPS